MAQTVSILVSPEDRQRLAAVVGDRSRPQNGDRAPYSGGRLNARRKGTKADRAPSLPLAGSQKEARV